MALWEGRHINDLLQCLLENYFVLNDVRTSCGNLDHFGVGPTGLFAIESKNWRGVVTSDGQGELLTNGSPCSKPEVRKFPRGTMLVRDQIISSPNKRSPGRANGSTARKPPRRIGCAARELVSEVACF